MTKTKKTKPKVKKHFVLREVNNGYTLSIDDNDANDDGWGYEHKMLVFKTADDVLEFIQSYLG